MRTKILRKISPSILMAVVLVAATFVAWPSNAANQTQATVNENGWKTGDLIKSVTLPSGPFSYGQSLSFSATVDSSTTACYHGWVQGGVEVPISNDTVTWTETYPASAGDLQIAIRAQGSLALLQCRVGTSTDWSTYNWLPTGSTGVGPTQPQNVSGEVQSDGSLKLNWDASVDADGVKYYALKWDGGNQSTQVSDNSWTIAAGGWSYSSSDASKQSFDIQITPYDNSTTPAEGSTAVATILPEQSDGDTATGTGGGTERDDLILTWNTPSQTSYKEGDPLTFSGTVSSTVTQCFSGISYSYGSSGSQLALDGTSFEWQTTFESSVFTNGGHYMVHCVDANNNYQDETWAPADGSYLPTPKLPDTITIVAKSDGSLTLQWTAPTNTPVSQYTVQWSTGNGQYNSPQETTETSIDIPADAWGYNDNIYFQGESEPSSGFEVNLIAYNSEGAPGYGHYPQKKADLEKMFSSLQSGDSSSAGGDGTSSSEGTANVDDGGRTANIGKSDTTQNQPDGSVGESTTVGASDDGIAILPQSTRSVIAIIMVGIGAAIAFALATGGKIRSSVRR